MLDLYHWEPNGASGRVLIALQEKGLAFSSCYVDVLAFEQYRPEILELTEQGEVPLLVHDGAAYTEATYICEFLDEAFPSSPLLPKDARGRWQVRVWQKSVDDGFAASVSELAWQAYGGARGIGALVPGAPVPDALGPGAPTHTALCAAVERIPVEAGRKLWEAAVTGLDEEQLARARDRVRDAVKRIEGQLSGSRWLAGTAYSLADIAVFPYFKYLPELCPDLVSDDATPQTMSWMRAVGSRPAVRSALGRGRVANPFTVAAPGPEQVRWG